MDIRAGRRRSRGGGIGGAGGVTSGHHIAVRDQRSSLKGRGGLINILQKIRPIFIRISRTDMKHA